TWRGVILYLSKGETIPIRLPVFRSLGVSLVHPTVGLVLAGIATLFVAFRSLRRKATPLATAARIVLPSALMFLFVVHLNLQGGVPLPVLVLVVVALIG